MFESCLSGLWIFVFLRHATALVPMRSTRTPTTQRHIAFSPPIGPSKATALPSRSPVAPNFVSRPSSTSLDLCLGARFAPLQTSLSPFHASLPTKASFAGLGQRKALFIWPAV